MTEVTYKKKNGDVIKRYVRGMSFYRVGYINAYGWEVISIKRCHNGEFYEIAEYDRIRNKEYQIERFMAELKRKLMKSISNLNYVFIIILFVRLFSNV